MSDTAPHTTLVRAASIEDAALLRRIRLAALSDSPEAFLERYENVANLSDAEWRKLVSERTSAPGSATFIAMVDDANDNTGLGMCAAFVESDIRVALVAMWVAPSARGTTIAKSLLDCVRNFARDLGAKEIAAWVVEDNHQAAGFYRKNSFQHDGVRQPYAPDPAKYELLVVQHL